MTDRQGNLIVAVRWLDHVIVSAEAYQQRPNENIRSKCAIKYTLSGLGDQQPPPRRPQLRDQTFLRLSPTIQHKQFQHNSQLRGIPLDYKDMLGAFNALAQQNTIVEPTK